MKKLLAQLSAFAFALTAGATTITTDKDASEIADIATAKTIFGATGLTLTASENASIYGLQSASGYVETLAIADGKTVSLMNQGANTDNNEQFAFFGSTLNITGGTLTTSITAEAFWRGTFNVYSDVNMKSFSIRNNNTAPSALNIYGNWTSASMSQQGGTITVYSGATAEFGAAAFWGAGAQVTIQNGATLTAASARVISSGKDSKHIYTNKLTVNGSATIRGNINTGTGGVNSAMFAANVTVGSTGSLVLQGTGDAAIVRGLDVAGSMSLGARLYLTDTAKLILREGANLQTEGAVAQEDSYISIANVFYENGGTGSRPVQLDITSANVTTATVDVELYGAQKLGGFNFYNDSQINLNFKAGSSLEVGGFFYLDSYEGDFVINISGDWGINNFKINSMSEMGIQNITFKLAGELMTLNKDYAIVEDAGGGYWVNAVVVPEPATFAVLFGALALGFACYRRRK